MSWITNVENLLNNIDQKAASVLQQQQLPKRNSDENLQQQIPKRDSSKDLSTRNSMILKVNKKKSDKDDYDSFSEKSTSSRHTILENFDDSRVEAPVEEINLISSANQITEAKIIISELKLENNELKMEVELLQEQMKTSNNAMKISELENTLAIYVDEKRDMILMNQSLENSNANYIKTISNLEMTIIKLQHTEQELKQKLEYSKNETKNSHTELQNHKLRALNQLQMKEKLIEQLKSGSQVETDQSIDSIADSAALQIEIDQLKNEKHHLQSELNLLSKRFDDSKSFIEKLEHKHRIMEATAEDKIANLNETINQFNIRCTQYDDEVRLQKRENSQIREEMMKQKTLMTTKLHEKENELKRLKNSYRESQMNSEIENRVQSLTQSLITKQNNLEVITSEKNALKFQLEKLSVSILIDNFTR